MTDTDEVMAHEAVQAAQEGEAEDVIPEMNHKAVVTLDAEDYEKMKVAIERGRRLARDAVNNDPGIFWTRSRRMREFRGDVIERYLRIHGGDLIEGPACYYGTFEVKFGVDVLSNGSGLWAAATLTPPSNWNSQPIVSKAFAFGIGDTNLTRLGGEHVVSALDTNIQNPGQNLFQDELFVVEALAARFRGLRVRYSDADVAKMGVKGTLREMMMGRADVWHRDEILPRGLRQQLRNVIGGLGLHFTWSDRGIGGSNVTTDAMIAEFAGVAGSGRRGPERATALPQGYLWCLDKQFQASRDQGGNGLFECELHASEPAAFPFKPLPVFGLQPGTVTVPAPPLPPAASSGNIRNDRAKPARPRLKKDEAKTIVMPTGVPTGLALLWEIRLHGTALLPGRRDYRTPETRRKH